MNSDLIRLGSTGISDEARSQILASLFSYEVLRDALYAVSDTLIIVNAAKCLLCGEIIESTSTDVHDFVTCSCGNISVDGRTDYLGRCQNTEENIGWIDLSVKQDKYS